MSGPQPVSTLICDFCGHTWQSHMDMAAHDEGPIDFRHCAQLMILGYPKVAPEATQVPALAQLATKYGLGSIGANTPVTAPVTVTGPTGPPGRNGVDGKDGRSVVAAHITVEQDGTKFLNLVMSDGTIIGVGGAL